jgi:3-hydroxyacyl-CoA dehydrogenase/enoyl-CoA hydratase/3-hydroxybutyryl-CoA epimerase
VTAALATWTVAVGKMPVIVKDSPGFVVNRVLLPYLYEATRLLLEGADVANVDRAVRRFGMPMGPYELLDQIGLDVAAHITRTLQPYFATRFPGEPVFDKVVQAGFLGQKSGRGFYVHDHGKPRVNTALPELLGLPKDGRQQIDKTPCQERLIFPMLNEAAACLGEGVVSEPEALDVAMVFGTGWAPHRGGPLRYADQLGLPDVVRILEKLKTTHGERFEPCAELRRRAAARIGFYDEPDHLTR